jgi:hypothetical protein
LGHQGIFIIQSDVINDEPGLRIYSWPSRRIDIDSTESADFNLVNNDIALPQITISNLGKLFEVWFELNRIFH